MSDGRIVDFEMIPGSRLVARMPMRGQNALPSLPVDGGEIQGYEPSTLQCSLDGRAFSLVLFLLPC